MYLVKSVYICIVFTIVCCDKDVESNGKLLNINSTVSGVAAMDLNNGNPTHLRGQIDIPLGSNSTLIDTTTKLNLFSSRRRRVLIINRDTDDLVLRSGVKKDGPRAAEKLLYQEFNDDGTINLSVEMKNLDDVAKFFKNYLDTAICHTYCENGIS